MCIYTHPVNSKHYALDRFNEIISLINLNNAFLLGGSKKIFFKCNATFSYFRMKSIYIAFAKCNWWYENGFKRYVHIYMCLCTSECIEVTPLVSVSSGFSFLAASGTIDLSNNSDLPFGIVCWS